MTAICEKHGTESIVKRTSTGCIIRCDECEKDLSENDSSLLDWLELVGGEIQFSPLSCKWWVNWYAGEDGTNHKSGLMFDTVRDALRSAFRGESDA